MLEIIEVGDKKIWLVGTAHISRQSTEEVEQVIHDINPDTICIELCPTRYKQLTENKRWKNTNITQIIKSGQAGLLLANLMLSSFQKKMGKQLGVKPGEEMLNAIKIANEKDIPVEQIDRDMSTTLKRTWYGMTLFERFKILNELLLSMFYTEKFEENDIEKLKNTDMITVLIEEVGKAYPKTKLALIDERDTYMAQKLLNAKGKRIVAVVGAGHMQGIQREIRKETDLAPLEEIPQKSGVGKALKYLVPMLIVALFIYGFYAQGDHVASKMLGVWIASHSILAALGVLIAGGGILSTLIAGVVAPVSPFNPVLKVAILPSLMEAYVHKPKVSDFEDLPNFQFSYKNLRHNRVTRVLLIGFLAAFFNMIATGISLGYFSSSV